MATRLPPFVLPTPVDPQVQSFWHFWSFLPRRDEIPIPHLRDYLASAPSSLQANIAVANIYSESRITMPRFGTALTKVAGADLTGIDPLSMYSDRTRLAVTKMAWTVVTRPCGYTCARLFETAKGRILDAPGIVLPIKTDSVEYKSMLLFTNIEIARSRLEPNDTFKTILDVEFGSWIDLGSGVPTFPM